LSACAELITATARTTISQYLGALVTAPPVAAASASENIKWRTAVPTERMQGRSRSKATPRTLRKGNAKIQRLWVRLLGPRLRVPAEHAPALPDPIIMNAMREFNAR
jgi:hypothetical protein